MMQAARWHERLQRSNKLYVAALCVHLDSSVDVMSNTCSYLQYTSWCNIALSFVCSICSVPCLTHTLWYDLVLCFFILILWFVESSAGFLITGPSPAERAVIRSVACSLALKNAIYFKYRRYKSPQEEGDVHELRMGKNTKGSPCALTK
jgi:hypothetical protein